MFVFGLEPISSCAEVIFGKNLFLITLYFQWQAQASNLFPPALPWLPPSLSLSVPVITEQVGTFPAWWHQGCFQPHTCQLEGWRSPERDGTLAWMGTSCSSRPFLASAWWWHLEEPRHRERERRSREALWGPRGAHCTAGSSLAGEGWMEEPHKTLEP